MKKHVAVTLSAFALLSVLVSLPIVAEVNQPGPSYVDFGQGSAEWMVTEWQICLLGLAPAPASSMMPQIVPTGPCPAIACQTPQDCCDACLGAHYGACRNGFCAYGW